MRRTGRWIAAMTVGALVLGACSDDGTDITASGSEPGVTTTTVARSDGPAADLTEELTGGAGVFIGAATTNDLSGAGYVEAEHVAAGTATEYVAEGPLTEDGRWTFVPGGSAAYRTRVLVRRPADPADFSGTVLVEWLNVSGGVDANPDWASLSEEIVRRGHAWVGASAQLVGVEGSPVLVTAPGAESVAGRGLVGLDPERYGSLSHPGDGFSFDIYTQVARALRAGAAAMGDLDVARVLAVGESQSAIALTTYHNGVQPLTGAFDGFLLHSRANVALPLVGPGQFADLAGSITGSVPTLLRDDLGVPVVELQAEGDVVGVLNSLGVRQPDTGHFRLWEVAGTAHADAHLLGPIAASADCGGPVNDGPLHLVAKAALRRLDEWVAGGDAPPEGERLEIADTDVPTIARDDDGIALGGIRTPPVDVPVAVLSGEPGDAEDLFCLLLGSTRPLSADRLATLYDSPDDYSEQYEAAAEEVVSAGFVLEDDREALMGYADPSRLGSSPK